ncbi:DUF6894 family protein [Methylobacterium soli]|uniref:DUF6894 domain-containing protein n=1 Tax=Methylobacterium soli TaxID=553447 RepID=A0A6L3SR96_9HYPH|nr:hypothetical protein [Methylobacterium soli]KAB1068760.1 hypothetical protein F6X53_31340 [Methylobacterium soli]GJE41504.1 hypothetical protein AEGHOMDF_0670 [Methylobacterium soli]
MPRFHFHLQTPDGREQDEDGLKIADLETAYLDACRAIPDMAADMIRRGQQPMRFAFEIADAGGQILMEVPFSEILDKTRRPRQPAQAARKRRAQEEIARTERLCAAIEQNQRALSATLQTTRELMARARKVGAQNPWHGPG